MKKMRIARIFLLLLLVYLVFNFLTVGGKFCIASSNLDSSLVLTAQKTQEPAEKFLPGPSFMEKAANFLYVIYDYIRKAIIFLLEKTVFKGNSKLANFYGDVASFLASLTAVYLLLLLVASTRKIIGMLLFLGWALFVVAIVIRG